MGSMPIENHPIQRVSVIDNVVPPSFTKSSAMQRHYGVAKGALNRMRMRPDVLNEHVDSSREVQSTVTSSNIVGQIFKASGDNINSVYLTLSSAVGIVIDDFESYVSSAALQAAWAATGELAILNTTVVDDGLQSMELPGPRDGDEWFFTIAPFDMTGFNVALRVLSSEIYSLFQVSVSISDGVHTKRYQLVMPSAGTWHTLSIEESAMTEDDPANPVDVTQITKIGFRIEEKQHGASFYIDSITKTTSPGVLKVKLWNMGATLPIDGVTTLGDGVQYTSLGDLTEVPPTADYDINLVGGQRLYHVHNFIAGVAEEIPTNETLVVGNYYALTLHYVDTNVDVWGPNLSYETKYYNNGYAFTTGSEVAAVNAIGPYSDLMFGIFSTQETFIYNLFAQADAVPNGSAEFHAMVEDKNMRITDVIHTHGITVPQQNNIDLTFCPVRVPKGGKFELDYGDDASDDVTEVTIGATYLYAPPAVWG